MKSSIVLFLVSVLFAVLANGQNHLSLRTQVEVSTGIVLPYFGSGNELIRAKEIRDRNESYFENGNGDRANVGEYSRQQGWNLTMAFYKPVKKIKGFMLGGAVRNALTASTPETGGYEEGYYFNFLTASITAKYYPFTKNNAYIKGDFGMGSVWTKNRFIYENGEQNFFHQFGVGTGGVVGMGYSLTPFKNKDMAIDVSAIYQFLNTRVEVDGIGDDQWSFSALNFQLGFTF